MRTAMLNWVAAGVLVSIMAVFLAKPDGMTFTEMLQFTAAGMDEMPTPPLPMPRIKNCPQAKGRSRRERPLLYHHRERKEQRQSGCFTRSQGVPASPMGDVSPPAGIGSNTVTVVPRPRLLSLRISP
jgi:hypothetical protein